MGFCKVWSHDEAYNIKTGKIEKLPFNVRAGLLDTESSFYIIPVYRIPYGIGTGKPGSLVVCASHDGGVAIKAWKFTEEEWQQCSLNGGIHVDEFARLIKIENRNGDLQWEPAQKEAWRNPGTIKAFSCVGDGWSHYADYENESFQKFMNDHYPLPVKV